MTGYLLDTNIVSILSPTQNALSVNRAAVEWLSAREERVFLSVVTIVEIESGIRQLVNSGSTRKAVQLESWLEQLIDEFDSSLLEIDKQTARVAGRLDALARSRGRHPGSADILIAATAVAKGLTVVTRNTRHFSVFELATTDPFKPPETSA